MGTPCFSGPNPMPVYPLHLESLPDIQLKPHHVQIEAVSLHSTDRAYPVEL